MTDSEIPELLQNRLEQALTVHGMDTNAIALYHREIGNGAEFAIRAHEGSTAIFESNWYSEMEMNILLDGMDTLDRLQDKL